MNTRELSQVVFIAVPSGLSAVGWSTIQLLSIILVGKLVNSDAQASTALVLMTFNVSGAIVPMGMSAAIDTLVSQQFGLDSTSPMSGVFLQRSLLVCFLMSIPSAIMWINAIEVFRKLGQSEVVSTVGGSMMKIFIFCLLPQVPAECVKRYFQAQNRAFPPMLGIFFSAFVHPFALVTLLPYLLEKVVAVCYLIALLLQCLVLALYWVLAAGPHKQTWGGWSSKAIDPAGLCEVFALGFPGMLMYMAEAAAFESCTLWAAWLPDSAASQAAQGVMINISAIFYMVPLGIGVAAATRVGNWVGAGDQANAISALRICYALAIASSTATGATILILRKRVPLLFTNDELVMEKLEAAIIVWCFFHLPDAMQAVGQGALRGLGLQKIGVVINCVCFYIIGMPSVWFFGFHLGFGVEGFWIGLSVGQILAALALAFVAFQKQWWPEMYGTFESRSTLQQPESTTIGQSLDESELTALK